MNKGIGIGIVVGIIAIGIGLASPLFYDVEINEPLPEALKNIEEGLTFEKFSTMDDGARKELVVKMPDKVKDMIMDKAATMENIVSEDMSDMDSSQTRIIKSGNFDGLAGHSANP